MLSWRGRTTVLVTAGDDPLTLVDSGIDFDAHLDRLRKSGFNTLRVFSGTGRALPSGSAKRLYPWARSAQPGHVDGGAKLDLATWNPAYFERLRALVTAAGEREIIVGLRLFSAGPDADAPWSAKNALTAPEPGAATSAVQIAVARRCAAELATFDNVYFELPIAEAGDPWAARREKIVETIASAGDAAGPRHLVFGETTKGTPLRPSSPGVAGSGSWERLLDGDPAYLGPHGSATTEADHRPATFAAKFLRSFDLVTMKPARAAVTAVAPPSSEVRVLALEGAAYCIHVGGGTQTTLTLDLPAGRYMTAWADPLAGKMIGRERIEHPGGPCKLASPGYDGTALLKIRRQREHLVLQSDFESPGFKGWNPSGNQPILSRDQVRIGRASMKSLLHPNTRVLNRCEIAAPRTRVGRGYWFGYSVYLPESYTPNDGWEMVSQWHGVADQDIGEGYRLPPLALVILNGRWRVTSNWDTKRISPPFDREADNSATESGDENAGCKRFDLGPCALGTWTDWVIHTHWSHQKDGILEVWRDGTQVIDRRGPNTYNDAVGPYIKIGLYRNKKAAEQVSTQFVFHDEFRMGSAEASYVDVAPW